MNTTFESAPIEILRPCGRRATTCSTISPTVRWRVEAGLTGGAEAARHRAAGLARHADRGAVAVQHQHRFDPAATVELPEELHGVAPVAHRLGHRRQRGREPLGEVGSHRLGHIRPVVGLGELLVQPTPHLVDPVAGRAVEQRGELLARDVVSSGHGHRVPSLRPVMHRGFVGASSTPDVAFAPANRRSRGRGGSELGGELFVVGDPAAAHVEARSPERDIGHVETERLAQLLCGVHPRPRQQVGVADAELVGILAVFAVETEAEQQAVGVRPVVEVRPVVVRLEQPQVRVARVEIDPLAVGLGLRVEHQLVEFVHTQRTASATVEHRRLEDEPRADVDHDLIGAGEVDVEEREPLMLLMSQDPDRSLLACRLRMCGRTGLYSSGNAPASVSLAGLC